MKISIRKGLGFGLTSGIITTLGMIVGLGTLTNSKMAVLGGVLMIAIADSLSDALGFHISEESGHKNTSHKEIWESTLATFFFKFIFAISFILPLIFLNLRGAIVVSIIWGFLLIILFSWYIAKIKENSPLTAISEHLIIGAFVLLSTKWIGSLIRLKFG
jgi:vacuolar iron transporter family protein